MRFTFTLAFIIIVLSSAAQTVLFNNGTVARVNPGCIVFINNGDVKNNSGILKNAGLLTVENDFINNDTATGGNGAGLYKVQGDFINNDVFISDQSQVLLYGANQQITGSSITNFYDLTLAGTGIKSQTIDARVSNQLDLADLELATGSNILFVDNTNVTAISENGGFVSSTGNGRLSRNMLSSVQYFYPVGSSLGIPRIRPVMLRTITNSPNTFAVRFANTDPSNEGYDRNNKAATICGINEKFYHLIDHTLGNTAADISIYYDDALDGSWSGIGHWQTVPQWQNTSTASTGTNGSYELLNINSWNNFTYPAFALINFGQVPAITYSGNTLTVNPAGTSYQWYFNDTIIPSATEQSYTTLQSGTYYVIVNYSNGCVSQAPAVEFSPSSVNEMEGLNSFNVFPNPGSSEVYIQADFNSPNNIILQFTNVLGQQLIVPYQFKNTSLLREKIDVSQFANGVYFITLLSESGQSSIPFIKN